MVSVGGIFHQRADAQKCVDALMLAGVERESIRTEALRRSLEDVLGPLGIPTEAIREYERQVVPGDTFVFVNTEALPAEAIVNEVARTGGLVVQAGYTSAGHPGDR